LSPLANSHWYARTAARPVSNDVAGTTAIFYSIIL